MSRDYTPTPRESQLLALLDAAVRALAACRVKTFDGPLDAHLAGIEREAIATAVSECGSVKGAAVRLGLKRSTLRDRMLTLGMRSERSTVTASLGPRPC